MQGHPEIGETTKEATKFILQDYSTDYKHRLLSLNLLPLMMVYELHEIGETTSSTTSRIPRSPSISQGTFHSLVLKLLQTDTHTPGHEHSQALLLQPPCLSLERSSNH